jgi:hypothetical protein
MTTSLSEILDDDARRAAAQKAINRTLRNYILIKVGVTVGVAAAVIVVNKIIENKMKTDSPE